MKVLYLTSGWKYGGRPKFKSHNSWDAKWSVSVNYIGGYHACFYHVDVWADTHKRDTTQPKEAWI